MDAILKRHWLVVSLVICGVAILIGDVDKYFPPGQLVIWLEVGIAGLGLGGIFVWAYWASASGVRKRAVKTDAAKYMVEKQEKYS